MRPESSPEALELARPCVHAESRGLWTCITYRPPGSDSTGPGIVWQILGPGEADRITAAAEELAHLLAPLVDLGLRRAEAARIRPLPRMEPAHDDPDQNLDPDD